MNGKSGFRTVNDWFDLYFIETVSFALLVFYQLAVYSLFFSAVLHSQLRAAVLFVACLFFTAGTSALCLYGQIRISRWGARKRGKIYRL